MTLNTARRDQEGFARLQEHFNDDEIVELTWVAALFNMINRINDALWLDIEDEDLDGIKKPVDEQSILEFARRMVEYGDGPK